MWTRNGAIRFAAIIALSMILLAASVPAATIQLPRGTEVKVKFVAAAKVSSGNLAKDVPVLFTLAEPVIIGGETLVEAGATGTAKVVEVEKAGKAGKAGYIKVAFVDLDPKGIYQTADKAKIKLTGEVENKGKGKKFISMLFIAGLFIKGGQGEIPANVVYTAKVAESITLENK
ncbi:MAG: hypothetical protein PHR28_02455 [candidate division Zixibacteria bacterium]|nr:hypothetical protein [candidate division Zixibacteria bacterium]